MDCGEISLEEINLTDETYRVSERLDSERLRSSLQEIGQLNPILLLRTGDSGLIPVCGFRRLHALNGLGCKHVMSRILPADGMSDIQVFRMALWDNLAHREFNVLEKARALDILVRVCGADHRILIGTYLPALGLAPHKNTLRGYLALHGLPPELRSFLLDGRLTLASAERISGKCLPDQEALARAFELARWSSSLQRQFLDLLDELSVLEARPVREILNRAEISSIFEDPDSSPFQRGERCFRFLYAWKNPRLTAAEQRFEASKRKLGLPAAIRLTPEPFFETPRLRAEFEAKTPDDFRRLAAAVHRASASHEIEELFDVR